MYDRPLTPHYIHPTTSRAIRRCVAALRRAVRAHTIDDVSDRLDDLWLEALDSAGFSDVYYRAGQRLRDVGELDPEEAFYLLDDIYGCREDDLLDDDAELTSSTSAYATASDRAVDAEKLRKWYE